MDDAQALFIPRARLLDPATGRDTISPLFIDPSGRIAPPPAFPLDSSAHLTILDRDDLIVMPGACDVHVHFRDPGNTAAEDLSSGSRSAAFGGFTRAVAMPNTSPATDSPDLVRRTSAPNPYIKLYASACCSASRAGHEPANLEALAQAGACCFTDDGNMVSSPEVMRSVMLRAKALGRVVMDHAVRPDIQAGGVVRDCPTARTLNLPIFPAEAEVQAVRDDIARCRETGCALHIQHLSCGESVNLIRAAQAEGLPVSAEATPHHLALAAEDIPGDDANWRMNPPLGNRSDVAALRQGVLDGTLALFATDHAPHTLESKSHGFRNAPFGIIGLETALPITWSVMVNECLMPPLQWAAHWSLNPYKLLGLPPPTLALGEKAELTFFCPSRKWKVCPENLASRSQNTPWLGQTITGRAVGTYREGRFIQTPPQVHQ